MKRIRVGSNLILCIDPTPGMLKDASPWHDEVEGDLGIALVELFAHVGEILAYYQDKMANEAYLDTARTRGSMRIAQALAKLISQAALLEARILRSLADRK